MTKRTDHNRKRPPRPEPASVKARVSRWLHVFVPSRYIAEIYALFAIFGITFFCFHFMEPDHGVAKANSGSDFASDERYNGETSGDIVTDEPNGPVVHQGHSYKVLVVYTAYHQAAPHYFQTYALSSSGKMMLPSGVATVAGRITSGPSIICVGHDTYAVIGAPKVERSGFLHLGWRYLNTIDRIGGRDQELDTSLYSVDCSQPDASTISRLVALAGP